jgi:hypothetical protein
MSLLEMFSFQFVMRLVMQNFVLLLMKLKMNPKKEQMTLVIRFVDRSGFIRENFFNIVHVKDTTTSTLKRFS